VTYNQRIADILFFDPAATKSHADWQLNKQCIATPQNPRSQPDRKATQSRE
jgi:hypothetical protein